jgi:serine protease SohB
MKRVKEAKLGLIVCVDEVAASGGFLMAAVADQIYAGPFAVLGSIGVVSSMPNFAVYMSIYLYIHFC